MIQGVCHDTFIYFSLLSHTACFSEELRYTASLICLQFTWFFVGLLTRFYSVTSSTVNFTVEQSEVLSVVIVLCF